MLPFACEGCINTQPRQVRIVQLNLKHRVERVLSSLCGKDVLNPRKKYQDGEPVVGQLQFLLNIPAFNSGININKMWYKCQCLYSPSPSR